MAWFGSSPPPKPPAGAATPATAAAPTAAPATLACSFCGKSQKEVKKLIAGPSVYICDECIALCTDIVAEDDAKGRAIPPLTAANGLLAALRKQVVGMEAATAALAAATAQHLARAAADAPLGRAPVVLIVGPRGSGKTTLARALTTATTLPRVMTDANRVTATGYVGDDIENVLFELLEDAGNALDRAERGLVVIDGVHRWGRASPGPSVTRDVSGEGVQRNLVRILDGDRCRVVSGTRHPSLPATLFSCARVQIVLTATLDAPAATDRALRDQLVAEGLLSEVLARVDRIVRVDRPDAAALATILRRQDGVIDAHNALLKPLGAGLALSPDAVTRLAAWAAAEPDAGWALHRPLSRAAEVALSGTPRTAMVDAAALEAWL